MRTLPVQPLAVQAGEEALLPLSHTGRQPVEHVLPVHFPQGGIAVQAKAERLSAGVKVQAVIQLTQLGGRLEGVDITPMRHGAMLEQVPVAGQQDARLAPSGGGQGGIRAGVVEQCVEARHAQQPGKATQMRVGNEAGRARRRLPQGCDGADVQLLELGVYGHPLLALQALIEPYGLSIDQQQCHLGVRNTQRFDHMTGCGQGRAGARERTATALAGQKALEVRIEAKGDGSHSVTIGGFRWRTPAPGRPVAYCCFWRGSLRMELLFLGTSSGTPTRARNVSGLAVLAGQGKGWYLVDCGEGTQHRVLRTPLSLQGLAGVFITHVHGDHCYGLPGLLASAGLQGRTLPLDIIAPEGIETWLRATFELTHTWLPFELRFHATEALVGGECWHDSEVAVSTAVLAHRVPSYAYRLTEQAQQPRLDRDKLLADGIERGPAWGALIRGGSVEYQGRVLHSADYVHFDQPTQCIVVAGDNSEPHRLAEACLGAQVLVHEATYTAEVAKGKTHHGHSSGAAVAAFAQQVQVPNLVLTHFSPRYQANPRQGLSIEDLRQEAAAAYGGNLVLAADFDRYRLSREGLLSRAPQGFKE